MGAPKQSLILPDRRTMLDHVAGALKSVCAEVVVASGLNSENVQGFRCIPDLRPGRGPLAGIEALLASGISTTGQCIVCPCDVPLITPSLLQLLLTQFDRSAGVFIVQGDRDIQPLPARISVEALPAVKNLLDRGRDAVWQLMREINPARIEITQGQAIQLRNVNTPADWQALRGRLPLMPKD